MIQASHVSTGTTNNALALNPSGGNVGVGTTAPATTFEVYRNGGVGGTTQMNVTSVAGTGTTTNSSIMNLRIQGAGGGLVDNAISAQYNPSGSGTYSLAFSPMGTTVMTALGSGNVGIGTMAPGAALHVVGSVVSYTYTHGYSGGTPTWSISNPLPNGTYLVSMSGLQTISYTGTFNYAPFAIGTTQIASLGGIASISFTAATLSVTFNAASAQNVVINFLRLG